MNALNSLLTAMAVYLRRDWHHSSGERGLAYALQGRVQSFALRGKPNERRIEATVKGKNRDPYLVDLILYMEHGEPQLLSHCSCPVYHECKHCFAAVLAFMAAAWRGIPLQDPPNAEMAEGVRRASAALPGNAFQTAGRVRSALSGKGWGGESSVQETSEQTFNTAGEATAVTPTADFEFQPEQAFALDQGLIDAVIAAWPTRQGALTALEGLVRSLLVQPRESWRLSLLFERLQRMESPYDALRALPDQIAAEATSERLRMHDWQPQFQARLDVPEFEEQAAAWLDRHAAAQLEAWINAQQAALPSDRLRARLRIVHETGGVDRLYFELLLTSAKLRDEPRTTQAIEQLMADLRNSRRRFEPAQEALLRAIAGNDQRLGPVARENPRLLAVNSAAAWITRWADSGLLAWEDETIPRLTAHPAHLRPRASEEGGERVAWDILWPAASAQEAPEAIPLTQAQLFQDGGFDMPQGEHPSVFVRRGAWIARVDGGGMPLHVLSLLRRTGSVPRTALEEGRAAVLIERLGSGATGAAAGLVQELPATPYIELRLQGPDQLYLVAWAQGEGGEHFVYCGGHDWREIEIRPETEALERFDAQDPAAPPLEAAPVAGVGTSTGTTSALARRPRGEDVEPVQHWLRQLIPPGERPVHSLHAPPAFIWELNRRELSRIYHALQARPESLRVFAEPSLAARLRPLTLRTPRVTVESRGAAEAWLMVRVGWEPEIEALTDHDVRAALAAAEGALVELPGGRSVLRDELDAYLEQRELLARAGLAGEGPQRLHALQAAALEDELLELLDPEGDEGPGGFLARARALVGGFKGIPQAHVPRPTADWLRPYQRIGVDFLVWAAQSIGGALLADDMGLGKTLQMLAALTALRASEPKPGPTLIICPASVVHNWRREAQRFAPDLRVCVLERGPQRHAQLARLHEYDLVIKNFTLARIEIERLREYEWFAICVDEAQAIKNPLAATTVALRSLNARYRFALTGTPVENRVSDLWSIVQFIVPGWLGPLRDLERQVEGASAEAVRQGLRARLRPILLRRLKEEVAPELPPRIEERLDCDLSAPQRRAYLAEVKRTRELLDGLEGSGAGQGRIRMLAALTRLRQICCDPGLLGIEDAPSGKIEELLRLLPELLAAGHKVLIFSQFVRMLERLRPSVEAICPNVWTLTGKTRHRQATIDAFEAAPSPAVFMISLKAGGTGLNLTSASHVILFDPWWNPAAEAQAIDRTHRIGQKQTVVALRLISLGTIEERIIELQARKNSLVQSLVGDEAFAQSLTREDFASLLDDAEI